MQNFKSREAHVLRDATAIHRLAETAERVGCGHLQPIFRAVLAGRIAAAGVADRQARFPRKMVKQSRLPIVFIIGDDDYRSTGPTDWACARAAADWCAAAIIHGAGGEAAHYAEAVNSAVQVRRLLLVETDSAHLPAWAALLTGKPRLAVVARGSVHPVASDRGLVH